MIRPAYTNIGVPVGRQVARRIPWWSSSKVRVNQSNAAAGQEYQFPGQSNSEIFTRNQFAWPLHITEIRMWAQPGTIESTRTAVWNSMKKTAFRFNSSRHGYLNSKWLPGMTFNTETNRHMMGPLYGTVYTLPTDYYLQRGATMLADIIPLHSDLNNRYIQMAMRGYDPTNDSPIIVTGRLGDNGTSTTQAITFAFDDERDQPVRDMWVRDFCFSLVEDTSTGYSRDPWLNMSIRFYPIEGTHWCLDERTPLTALIDQVPAFNLGHESTNEYYYPDPPTIYKPAVPFVLLPGDMLTVEAKLLDTTFWSVTNETWDIWVHFRGYQEGARNAT